MKKTAIVILNWNGRTLLERFLPSLVLNTPAEQADIIVADNGSTDDSIVFLQKHYPQIQLIELEQNYGFAAGYNMALEQVNHEYLVLLNTDVEVTPGWFSTAINYLDSHPETAALQPKLLSYQNRQQFEYAGASGGFIDRYGYPFCRGRIFLVWETDKQQYDDEKEVLWATGACLFIRNRLFKDAGGFDPYFFAHQEEIDLCWRLRNKGYSIVCLPSSVVFHVGGATLAMEHPRKTFLNFRNNLVVLYKNLPEKEYRRAMRVRWFTDRLAAFVFLCKGAPRNAWSIFRARQAFNQYRKEHPEWRSSTVLPEVLPEQVYKQSLLIAYYLRGKRRFSQM